MSFTKKIVSTYSKSLFQNVNNQLSKIADCSDDVFPDLSTFLEKGGQPYLSSILILGEELILLRSVLLSSKKLTAFFNNPTYAEHQKLNILTSLFPGLTTTMQSFLRVLSERSHLSLLPEICEEYQKILLKFKKITYVKMSIASVIEENSGEVLLKTLKKITSAKEILLNVSYNPKLLGGFILEYNSTALDASILKEFSLFFNEF
jgi:F-type H+-transporting ATPase subunit delta